MFPLYIHQFKECAPSELPQKSYKGELFDVTLRKLYEYHDNGWSPRSVLTNYWYFYSVLDCCLTPTKVCCLSVKNKTWPIPEYGLHVALTIILYTCSFLCDECFFFSWVCAVFLSRIYFLKSYKTNILLYKCQEYGKFYLLVWFYVSWHLLYYIFSFPLKGDVLPLICFCL